MVKYIALKRLNMGRGADGSLQFREVGEEVPEAHTWRNLNAWIAGKYIRAVIAPDSMQQGKEELKNPPPAPVPTPERHKKKGRR